MAEFNQYPLVTSTQSTDLFVLSRSPHAPGDTKVIEAGNMGLFTPLAGQMTLIADTPWVSNLGSANFFPPWDSLVTNSAPTPAYNPDGIASLTAPVPGAAPVPGTQWPGFIIPVAGVYMFYANINMNYNGTGPFEANFETFMEIGNSSWSNASALNSNERPGSLSLATPGTFVNSNLIGGRYCDAGDVAFVGIVDNTSNDGADLVVTALSYFGCYRVR